MEVEVLPQNGYFGDYLTGPLVHGCGELALQLRFTLTGF